MTSRLVAPAVTDPTVTGPTREVPHEAGFDPPRNHPAALVIQTGQPMRDSRVMAWADAGHDALSPTMGIKHLAIDDFGTGYSSLSYLQRFPVTDIKIDRSFIQDFTTNRSSAAIAASIFSLAHSLDLRVIAEGLETVPQRACWERI